MVILFSAFYFNFVLIFYVISSNSINSSESCATATHRYFSYIFICDQFILIDSCCRCTNKPFQCFDTADGFKYISMWVSVSLTYIMQQLGCITILWNIEETHDKRTLIREWCTWYFLVHWDDEYSLNRCKHQSLETLTFNPPGDCSHQHRDTSFNTSCADDCRWIDSST